MFFVFYIFGFCGFAYIRRDNIILDSVSSFCIKMDAWQRQKTLKLGNDDIGTAVQNQKSIAVLIFLSVLVSSDFCIKVHEVFFYIYHELK